MNYFAHALPFLDEPYLVAGTAVPDWLNVVDRRAKARSRRAAPLLQHSDPRVAALARGIVQHHHDDHWFHQVPAFVELQLEFAAELRALCRDDGFRPSFLGHILVELLLDAALLEDHPSQLDAYYDRIASLDRRLVTHTVAEMTPRDVSTLEVWIDRFCQVRFLYDYREDERLLMRLNMVMHRVSLPRIPAEVAGWLGSARRRVRLRQAELTDRQPVDWSNWFGKEQGETE